MGDRKVATPRPGTVSSDSGIRTRTPGSATAGSPIATRLEIRSPGCGIPECEHPAQRVADDGRFAELERVEDVLDQLMCALSDVTTSVSGGVGESVTGKVDREQSAVRERGK